MSFQKTKVDASLGHRVNQYLLECGVQTPMCENDLSNQQKIDIIEQKMKEVLEVLGLDLSDDSLGETPKRVAKMFVNELYWGLDADKFPKCTTVENKMGYDEMVVEKNITVMSDCEHHLRPIRGVAHVAYIPKDKVLGLSKLNRIVEYFARRPQIQERLAEQIYHALVYVLGTEDVAVVIDAEHFCVKQRGVEDHNSNTVTSKLGGEFKRDPAVRAEFMSIIRS
jgi:GTP cyclohydrolase I